ncbi:OprO/OprP family phosphate-selective porin [Dyella nitratireducens]|nr:porin [Dyella nitratireducens]
MLMQCALGMGVSVTASAYDLNQWPTRYTSPDGTQWNITGNYQYDAMFARHNAVIEDAHTHRRKEFGLSARKQGQWDAIVYFDFQSKSWLDVFWRVNSQWLFGKDYGQIRLGHSKPQVGFEGGTASRANSFVEMALPMQAFFETRRTGIDWAFERPRYLLNLGYYFASDLNGNNDGNTVTARAAWTPRKQQADVLHLGLSASLEHPHGSTDGRGVYTPASVRWRARPEAGLTDVRLIDTGSLSHVHSNRRLGFEGLWIHGPLSLQGEYLQARSLRQQGLPGYVGDGYYLFVSYVLTGESRTYAGGNVGNVIPARPWGAVELLLRHSALNLDHDPINGGHQHDLTLGVNWYLTQHFKFQANYVEARASQQGVQQHPSITELRAQVYF